MRRFTIAAAAIAAIATGGFVAVPAAQAAPHPNGWYCSGVAANGLRAGTYVRWGQAYSNFGAASWFHRETGARRVTCS